MKISTIALVLGSALVTCSVGAGLAACSSSSSPSGEPSPGVDSGTDTSTGMDSGGMQDSGTGSDTGTGGDTAPGTDAACASPPALFVPSADGGVYCPFSKDYSIDGGKAAYCENGVQDCCLSPSSDAGISTCQPTGTCATAFPGSSQWQCGGAGDCIGNAGGAACCLESGNTETNSACAGTFKTKGFDKTYCTTQALCTGYVEAGTYTDNLFIACEQNSDCPTGKTCIAIKTTGTSIGICQ